MGCGRGDELSEKLVERRELFVEGQNAPAEGSQRHPGRVRHDLSAWAGPKSGGLFRQTGRGEPSEPGP